MMLLSDFVINLMEEWQVGDAPVNILIDGQYYDIDNFYFDEETCEYMLKVQHPIDYDTRSDIVVFKLEKNEE